MQLLPLKSQVSLQNSALLAS